MANPGEAAEADVLALVEPYFPGAHRTAGSGACLQDGDIGGTPVFVEVKDQTKNKGFTIKAAEWDKTRRQAQRWDKHAVLVIRRSDKRLVAICDVDLLMLALSHIPEGVL